MVSRIITWLNSPAGEYATARAASAAGTIMVSLSPFYNAIKCSSLGTTRSPHTDLSNIMGFQKQFYYLPSNMWSQ